MDIISRKDAKALGLLRYFTGKACARGHVAERATSSTVCLRCSSENAQRKYSRNMAHYREKSREGYRRARDKAGLVPGRKKQTDDERRAADYHRVWRAKNRTKRNLDNSLRRIRRRKETIATLSKHQKGRCAYCRDRLTPGDIHIDHIHPRSLGGTNDRSNLQLTCSTCNMAKHAKPPEVYAREIGRLL